jgi:aminodeoxychorismate lyase
MSIRSISDLALPTVFLDGCYVPAGEARVSVFDRGFLYGDGLFETVAVHQGSPFRWSAHWQRLLHAARVMRLELPLGEADMRQILAELNRRNAAADCVTRLTITRGIGPRGYSPRHARDPVVVVSQHRFAVTPGAELRGWRVVTSRFRVLANDPVATLKSCNRLVQVLARAEAEGQGADEALLLNSDGYVAELAGANVFAVTQGRVMTPALSSGALPGVTRAVVLERLRAQDIVCSEEAMTPEDLRRADGVFATLTGLGIVQVTMLDGVALATSPQVRRVWGDYWSTVNRETAPA